MPVNIALLRGINVGGANKIEMARLRELFCELGCTNVSTYINSGNVIFSSAETDIQSIRAACEAAVAERFGVKSPIMVMPAEELIASVTSAPDWWGSDITAKHNAIFVLPPAAAEEIIAEIGATKPEYERIASAGRVIFWSAPIETYSRTRLSKIVGTKAYASVTIRNENTARKLAELATKELEPK
jgi:Uncharacterized protein conserved in bacteria